jgi:hypothetical protein
MNYYKTDPAKVLFFGTMATPCGGVFGAESGGLRWAGAASSSTCSTPTGQSWYVNIRFVNGTCPSGTCEIYYAWAP